MFIRFRSYLFYSMHYFKFLYALWRLSQIRRPIVSIFGGTNVPAYHPYYAMAYTLSKKLADHKVSIITGGGPGIMEAALCGAQEFDGAKNCLGIGVLGVDEYFSSQCFAPTIFLPNFAMRKWLLMYYSSAFIIFPGGIGTLDELSQLLNLIKTNRIAKSCIILIDKIYWKSFIDWSHMAISKGLLIPDFSELFMPIDNIDEAYDLLIKYLYKDKILS